MGSAESRLITRAAYRYGFTILVFRKPVRFYNTIFRHHTGMCCCFLQVYRKQQAIYRIKVELLRSHKHTHTHTHARTHARTHTHTHTHARTHARTHPHARTHVRKHRPTHAHTHARTQTHACTHALTPTTKHAATRILCLLTPALHSTACYNNNYNK